MDGDERFPRVGRILYNFTHFVNILFGGGGGDRSTR